ncbi:MmpS family transport accessory protein [Nocardia carnea]|uniref:MmpS family transport accessory protein n=1 Tax=Nocardia carnea TaxID=37328 RepID=UPI002455782E|nr:MmpS family transport accessory protein [Nocardia carnea]
MSNHPPYPPEYPGDDPSRRQRPGDQGQYPGQGQYPQGGAPPPYGAYPSQPPKKKPKWPWILVGGILLVILLVCGGCVALMGGIGNEIDKETSEEIAVTYEVTSDGPQASNISYSSGGDGVNTEQANQQPLPWTKEVTVTGFIKSVTLTAQADEGASTITCRILEGDEVIAEQTSTGPFAAVSCSGTAGD